MRTATTTAPMATMTTIAVSTVLMMATTVTTSVICDIEEDSTNGLIIVKATVTWTVVLVCECACKILYVSADLQQFGSVRNTTRK